MADILETEIQDFIFLYGNICMLDSNSIGTSSQWSNWQQITIGLGTGLALSRKETIIGNIDDPVYWRIYTWIKCHKLNSKIIQNGQ